jgi:basic amino acid/polyamine antiporter, APA family
MTEQTASFKPSLGLIDATMVVAGSMIGSGIFIVSSDITRHVGGAGWLVFVWLITGFMTITAAVSYGELSGMYPKAGGQYVYLKEAYNPLMGFLYGWSFFAVIQTATIAAVGVAFARFSAYLYPPLAETNILLQVGGLKISAAQLLAIGLIIFLTYTNTRGIKGGKIIQTSFTTVKLISLFGLIIAGFLLAKHSFWDENWQTGFTAMQVERGNNGDFIKNGNWLPIGGTALIGAIAAAMVGSIFSSDSWNNVTFIAGEIKNPKRNIGLSLFLGTLIVTIIYVTTNLMYLHVLPLQEIAFPEGERVAVAVSNSLFGIDGSYVIAVMIMISTFGCNNGLILAGARVYYAMAKDGLFFKKTGQLNKNAVPENGLWLQCVLASILCLSGSYGDLLDMISFVAVLFYALTIAGIFILRKKKPDAERPYKAFAYPVLPAIYIVLALVFCVFLIAMKPLFAGIGLGIVLAGIPLYYLAVSTKQKDAI